MLTKDSKPTEKVINLKQSEDCSVSNSQLRRYVKKTNEAFLQVEKSNSLLFETFENAWSGLGRDSTTEVWKRYISKLEVDKSTINKMLKVIKSDRINKNSSRLPTSWQTLHEICLMEDEVFEEKLRLGVLNSDTSKNQIKEWRGRKGNNNPQNKKAGLGSERNYIKVDLESIEIKHREEVRKIIRRLKELGFACEGVNVPTTQRAAA